MAMKPCPSRDTNISPATDVCLTSWNTRLSTFDHALRGPFDGVFPVQLSALWTLCKGLTAFIPASTVYSYYCIRSLWFVKDRDEYRQKYKKGASNEAPFQNNELYYFHALVAVNHSPASSKLLTFSITSASSMMISSANGKADASGSSPSLLRFSMRI